MVPHFRALRGHKLQLSTFQAGKLHGMFAGARRRIFPRYVPLCRNSSSSVGLVQTDQSDAPALKMEQAAVDLIGSLEGRNDYGVGGNKQNLRRIQSLPSKPIPSCSRRMVVAYADNLYIDQFQRMKDQLCQISRAIKHYTPELTVSTAEDQFPHALLRVRKEFHSLPQQFPLGSSDRVSSCCREMIGNALRTFATVFEQTGGAEFLHVVVHHGDRQRAPLCQLSLGDFRVRSNLLQDVKFVESGCRKVKALEHFGSHRFHSLYGSKSSLI